MLKVQWKLFELVKKFSLTSEHKQIFYFQGCVTIKLTKAEIAYNPSDSDLINDYEIHCY